MTQATSSYLNAPRRSLIEVHAERERARARERCALIRLPNGAPLELLLPVEVVTLQQARGSGLEVPKK